MNVFVRYFAELPYPAAVVARVVERLSQERLAELAREANGRGERVLVEQGLALPQDLAGTQVHAAIAAAVRGSATLTTWHTTWVALASRSVLPLLDGEIEVGAVGSARAQLALSARYRPPVADPSLLDRPTVLRVGEAVIKAFVDGLALVVDRSASTAGPAPAAAVSR